MTGETRGEWHTDIGRPAYELPLIVDTPTGKKDISDWAAKETRYDYWLCFRKGATEYNARRLYSLQELAQNFEHGKTYDGWQFIVEKLGHNITRKG